jgi:predicted DNA binding CopG/RHH family protein
MATKQIETKECQVNVRLSEKELDMLDKKMAREGIDSRSQYIRMLIRKACRK